MKKKKYDYFGEILLRKSKSPTRLYKSTIVII